jgi:hypothetical protein
MKSNSTIIKALRNLFILLGIFAFSIQMNGQNAPASKFVKTVITQTAGEYLSFELTNLPEITKYAKSDGEVHVLINWQIGNNCNGGKYFQSKVQVTKNTETVYTDYILSKVDNGKQIKINVSYINPQEGEVPAEYFILAQPNCTTIKVTEK